MIGFSVVSDNYTAFEPSTLTFKGLIELTAFLQTFHPDFNPTIHCECFEDAQLDANSYDFALTSPPYFNTEHYSEETTNSFNRYPTFREWRDGFYIPMIQQTLDALKPGASFILNIGSRKYPLNDTLMEVFGFRYSVTKLSSGRLSDSTGLGKGKTGEGETFYRVIA